MRKLRKSALLAVSGIAMSIGTAWAGDWCSGQTIRLFSGGPAGGAFNSIIDRGAMQAAEDIGANVQIIYSEWDFDKMVTQLREAISQAPRRHCNDGAPGR